jgi:hypothetical protein
VPVSIRSANLSTSQCPCHLNASSGSLFVLMFVLMPTLEIFQWPCSISACALTIRQHLAALLLQLFPNLHLAPSHPRTPCHARAGCGQSARVFFDVLRAACRRGYTSCLAFTMQIKLTACAPVGASVACLDSQRPRETSAARVRPVTPRCCPAQSSMLVGGIAGYLHSAARCCSGGEGCGS